MKKPEWIYVSDAAKMCRYVLGVPGTKMLGIFGINPSTAVPGRPDRTVNRMISFSKSQGFDGWILFNLYPQIATDPNALKSTPEPRVQKRNLELVTEYLEKYPVHSLWAAWGTLIEKREYLKQHLFEICGIEACNQLPWCQLDPPTLNGHPRHPLYYKASGNFIPFDISRYNKVIGTGTAG